MAHRQTAHGTRVTAVVPTWREAAEIERSLRSLREGGVGEIIVVDGGSDDDTVELARRHADKVLEHAGGLFAQLNHGARAASGDVLVFHYADVQFPVKGRCIRLRPRAGRDTAQRVALRGRRRFPSRHEWMCWRDRACMCLRGGKYSRERRST